MRRGPMVVAVLAGAAAICAGAFVGGAVLAPEQTSAQELPVSSLLAVSRRSDPSLDRYTRTAKAHTSLRGMNGAQQWLSSKAQPLVAHDSDPTVSLNATGWETNPNVAVYVNATGVNLYNRPQLHDAAKWLVKQGSVPVRVDGWQMLDVRNPDARHWWLYGSDGRASCLPERLRRAALDLIACGYRGLWVDNVLTVPEQWFRPNPGIAAADWGNGVVALLQSSVPHCRPAFPSRSTATGPT